MELVKADYFKYFVICLFVLVVVASGCTDSSTSPNDAENGDSPQQTDEAASDDSSGDSGDSSEPAEISLTSFNVPEEVEMGENFTVEATFENTGSKSGEFETTVMRKEQGESSFTATDTTIEGEVPPGDRRSYERTLKVRSVSSNIFGLAGTDAESNLVVTPKTIQIGEEYTTPDNKDIRVESVEFKDYYTYEESYTGEEKIEEPESGKYVLVYLTTQNKAEIPQELPYKFDFKLVGGSKQYESTVFVGEPIDIQPYDSREDYGDSEVQPGVKLEGYMIFNVDENLSKDDISVIWDKDYSGLDKIVYWIQGSEQDE